jgi:hypothetical protein
VLLDGASAASIRGGGGAGAAPPTLSLPPGAPGVGGGGGSGGVGVGPASPTSAASGGSLGSSSIAGDILGLLVVAALELDRGWRVWLSTLGCMRQRFGPVNTTPYLRGVAAVVSAVAYRVSSLGVIATPVFRVNVRAPRGVPHTHALKQPSPPVQLVG